MNVKKIRMSYSYTPPETESYDSLSKNHIASLIIMSVISVVALVLSIYAVATLDKGPKGDEGDPCTTCDPGKTGPAGERGIQGLSGFTFDTRLGVAMDEVIQNLGTDYEIYGQYVGGIIQTQSGDNTFVQSTHTTLEDMLLDTAFTGEAARESNKINYIAFGPSTGTGFDLTWNSQELLVVPHNPSFINYIVLVKKELYPT
jgi:hypothetical protein